MLRQLIRMQCAVAMVVAATAPIALAEEDAEMAAARQYVKEAIENLQQQLLDNTNRTLDSGTIIFQNRNGRNAKSFVFNYDSDGAIDDSLSKGDIAVKQVCERFGAVTYEDIKQCSDASDGGASVLAENTDGTVIAFSYGGSVCPSPRYYGMGFGYIQECPIRGPRGKGYYYFTYVNPSKHFAYMPYP